MFECLLPQGDLFKKIVASIQDLVQEGNFVCDENHMYFQGMDSSHVSLVSLSLKEDGFEKYRCDREVTLGINFSSLGKVLKCMGSDDSLTVRADEESDSAMFLFESPNQERVSNFELKLMDIDTEQLGIPDTEYQCTVKLPSNEFQRICRDLSAIGDTVTISATKEGVKFSVSGDIGNGEMTLKHSSHNNGENADENGDEDEDDDDQVLITADEPVQQTFALRYLTSFTKATSLSKSVTISMGAEVPLVTEYKIDDLGYVRYYLAPKIDDDDDN